uniref:Uncharacterized protein n=1 Tax=Aegilops tauschii subsp. strangulata TaxID=200361 RepID=A0A453JBF0_AEGTS
GSHCSLRQYKHTLPLHTQTITHTQENKRRRAKEAQIKWHPPLPSFSSPLFLPWSHGRPLPPTLALSRTFVSPTCFHQV